MPGYDVRKTVERFHLLFLDQLGRRLDKRIYSLKGGCNLRFFLRSIRYSEDIDIDIDTIRKDTLAGNVRKILTSQPLQMALAHHGIEIETVSEPKQTDTTQRWKLTLRCTLSRLPVHTKIEFSRRGLDQGTEFGPVDAQLIADYALAPILSTHYNRDRALYHKLEALAGRSETQARDVFDLYHLRHSGARLSGLLVSEELIVTAQEAALRVGYRDFLGQVVAYLPPNYQEQYSDPVLWQAMVLEVSEVNS